MTGRFFLILLLAFGLSGAARAQGLGEPPGEGPLDVSADEVEVFDREGRAVYSGDVNATRGDVRLRAERIEVFFQRREGGGFGDIRRLVAEGEVYYVTPTEVARGDRGVYEVADEIITLTGEVVLTQGCNVSTGEALVANLNTGFSSLSGAGGEVEGGRVRSVFFPDEGAPGEDESGAGRSEPRDCPLPEVPGDGPRDFDDPAAG
ncbi:hypothetical protein DDZ18_02050 [Marinicauda salina]|uniref:Organic solvent tolerance-like N-terminal domain-containing protein n=1 Tax=Marinicauda salina TaxID=2135793 RepID=A0A2U2BWL7_9PROT|nr:LptA/OstA family protein [Marinicauda salina]PWE18411.1 hypothetical protein DDZ18_02050 [Marinicauda salina]